MIGCSHFSQMRNNYYKVINSSNPPKELKENIIEDNWDSYTNEIKLYRELMAKLEEQINTGD